MRKVSYNVAVAALATEGATAAEPDKEGRPVDAEELTRETAFTVTTGTGEELKYEPRKRAEKLGAEKSERGGGGSESRLVAELRIALSDQCRLTIDAHKRLDSVSESHAKLLHESLETFASLRKALTAVQEPASALSVVFDKLSPLAARLEQPLTLLLVGLAGHYCPSDKASSPETPAGSPDFKVSV